MPLPYLLELTARLQAGLSPLPEETRRREIAFFRSKLEDDGGFAGREPGSDLYYTAFAVRALAMLGGLDEPALRERVAGYLAKQKERTLSVVDITSWLYSALVVQGVGGPASIDVEEHRFADRLTSVLAGFRTADGGFAKTAEGAVGSTYHSFLVVLVHELLGRSIAEPERMVEFLLAQKREDGGFVEIGPMRRSGTNPTAAAVATLRILGALDRIDPIGVGSFLEEVRTGEGGLQANTRIPFPDALSTFTGLLTAFDLGLPPILEPARVRRFLKGLEFPGGGYRGASWDDRADVEYSFYALGCLALVGPTG